MELPGRGLARSRLGLGLPASSREGNVRGASWGRGAEAKAPLRFRHGGSALLGRPAFFQDGARPPVPLRDPSSSSEDVSVIQLSQHATWGPTPHFCLARGPHPGLLQGRDASTAGKQVPVKVMALGSPEWTTADPGACLSLGIYLLCALR